MFPDVLFQVVAAAIAVLAALATTIGYTRSTADRRREVIAAKQEIERAESRLANHPEKVKPAWDLARVTLESYFNRNLSQVAAIFWISVAVMVLGFVIVCMGVLRAINPSGSSLPAVIAGVAGVITEFIGATFLLIYRSTMSQALDYTKTLERINAVGMAMQILDTIPDDASGDGLKNATKAEVVRQLMQRSP